MTTHQADSKLVDAWVRRSLTHRYEAVLQEKLPEEWLDLLKAPPRT